MTEPIRDADDALSREDAPSPLPTLDRLMLLFLDRYDVAVGGHHIEHSLELDEATPLLVSLAQRYLVERKAGGWRLTPAGRRAVGSAPAAESGPS